MKQEELQVILEKHKKWLMGEDGGCRADALEAAEKRVEELNTKCADLQSQINSMESEIEELLPKEGGWISNYDGFDYDVRCSVCGEEALIKEGGSHDYAYSRYCPNCGARMKGEQDG